MSDDILLVQTQDRIRTLTLNRPQARNALSRALRDAVFSALAEADADEGVDESQTATGLWIEAMAARQWMTTVSGADVAANRAAVLERGRAQLQ